MNEEKNFPKQREIRNGSKQSILILGQSELLYFEKEVKETFILLNGEKISIGAISDKVHIALEDLAKGKETKIIRETKTVKRPVCSIEGFTNISVQKHKKDTMIVVPAYDESTLIEKVNKLKEYLESKGVVTQERCNWMCVVDKGKVEVSNEEILKNEQIVKTSLSLNNKVEKKEMSDHTKSLRNIALKAIKEIGDKK